MRNSAAFASIVGAAIIWASALGAQEVPPSLATPGSVIAAPEVVPAAPNGEGWRFRWHGDR